MTIALKVVPIERWPGEQTRNRKAHPFRKQNSRGWMESSVNWSSTMETLERELKHLRAKDVLLQMAVTDRDIRNDGWIRANARPAHPGVILTFESKHGPLSYPCDTFRDWQANVRAIALALEALRKVDRYGVTRTGQQYEGWKRLPGAGQTTVTMGAQEAAGVLAEMTAYDPEDVLSDPDVYRSASRAKAKLVHPDTGADPQHWTRFQDACRVVEAHHGGLA